MPPPSNPPSTPKNVGGKSTPRIADSHSASENVAAGRNPLRLLQDFLEVRVLEFSPVAHMSHFSILSDEEDTRYSIDPILLGQLPRNGVGIFHFGTLLKFPYFVGIFVRNGNECDFVFVFFIQLVEMGYGLAAGRTLGRPEFEQDWLVLHIGLCGKPLIDFDFRGNFADFRFGGPE